VDVSAGLLMMNAATVPPLRHDKTRRVTVPSALLRAGGMTELGSGPPQKAGPTRDSGASSPAAGHASAATGHFCYITQAAASNNTALLQNRKDPMQTASIQWIGEQKFLAVSPSGHAVPFDSDRESNKAPGAMEMVLMALGACTATDMVLILEKKRQKLESLEVLCSGERAAEPPTVWTKLEVLFRLRGTIDEAAVKHAMSLTEEKYCSVAAMLKKTAAFTWRYEILPPSAAK
jgi:putative redox protein